MHPAIQRLVGAFSPDVAYFGIPLVPLIGPPLQLWPKQAWSLRARGIWTISDLWLRIGSDRPAGITRIAGETGVEEAHLALLVNVESGRRTPVVIPWVVRSGRWLHFLLPASINRVGGPDPFGRGIWIEESEADALRSKKIRSVSELWKGIGNNFETGLQDTVDDRLLDADRLRDLLAAEGVREARWAGSSRFARWTSNLGLAALLPVAVVLIWLAARQTLPAPYSGAATTPQVVALITGGIQPLHVIGPDDVAIRTSPSQSDAIGTKTAVVGRIARAQIYQNEVITNGSLFPLCPGGSSVAEATSPGTPFPDSRQLLSVLSLSVKNSSFEAVAPGDCATLMIAPHDPAIAARTPDPGLLFGVTVLAVDRGTDPGKLVIAVRAQDQATLARALGSSDIYVLPTGH